MAIVKATYTKLPKAIKASLAYYTARPTVDGERGQRTIFGKEGMLTRKDVVAMINRQRAGTYFYRIVLSPDPKSEDANRTLSLENLTRRPLAMFARRRRADLGDFAAVCHTDHSPNRHVHVIACFDRKLTRGDLSALRDLVTRQALGLSLDVSFASPHEARLKAQVPNHLARHGKPRRYIPSLAGRLSFARGGGKASMPQKPGCELCSQHSQLVWRFGALRCGNCGFAVRRHNTSIVRQEQVKHEEWELSLRPRASLS